MVWVFNIQFGISRVMMSLLSALKEVSAVVYNRLPKWPGSTEATN